MLDELTTKLKRGEDLRREEAEAALRSMLEEECPDDRIARFLAALHQKGETSEEIAGFASVMRSRSVKVGPRPEALVDTAGTGGGIETFNVSTIAAFVISGAGVAVAKHGNRAVTSRSGSADMLAALGVDVNVRAEAAVDCLNRFGLSFLFAPLFHPAMKRVAGIRKQLKHRTIFNLLGPLTNPASAPFQIIGVYDPQLTAIVAQALILLGCGRVWVVHSRDGMDEISHKAPTHVSEAREGQVKSFDFEPGHHGFPRTDGELRRGGSPQENAAICRGILSNQITGPSRDIVVLNAAAAIHVARGCPFAEAISAADEAISSGAAQEKLRLLIEGCAAK